jgi:hypothetical protein
MATATEAPAAKRRGRPRKGESKVEKVQNFSGNLTNTLRDNLKEIVGVCQTCGQWTSPVQPIADEVGITAVTLAKFIRGEAGLSMGSFDALWGYVTSYQEKAASEQADASEASEGAATA